MSLYAYLDKHLLYPLYYWRNGDDRLQHLVSLERAQYLPVEQLQALQQHRLKRLLHHAYHRVPYYRDVMLQGVDTPLAQLPILTKALLQTHLDRLLATDVNRQQLIEDASGGSTGQPTKFYKAVNYVQRRATDQIRHDRWSGWDIGEAYGLIWGASRDLQGLASIKQSIVTRYIHRCYPLDAFNMSLADMQAYQQQLEQVQPKMLLGYAGALAEFAQYLQQHAPDHGIRPQGIVSSAEVLTAEKKQLIESVFHCKVLNRYGSREVGLIASECQQQSGLHINADNVLVEIVDAQGLPAAPGEVGRVLVTDLWNFAMPLIRYELGDMAALKSESCCCGRTLPLLANVAGRISDFLIAEDGRKVHGEYFTHLFYGEDKLQQFQLLQTSRTDVVLKWVLKDASQKPNEAQYQQQIREVLGNVNVQIDYVDHIPLTASGKYLFTICQVPA
jgi:phenylacetate-CoA ligase